MKEINFAEIEKKWQQYWRDNQVYKADEKSGKPKYYALTMFPYPSGKGLHVGHPLSYVAADIVARFKKHQGFEVLHPMGFDAFGLPAEQYAIQTGKHPADTTAENIATYKKQLEILGLSYDWDREVRTSDPEYYKWTQWIFLQIFNSWYNKETDRAEPIETLVNRFKVEGSKGFEVENGFTADDWAAFSEAEQEKVLQQFRLAYLAYSEVNWCEALGTVLANDEVINGVSERGGHPVTKKKMRQWFLRITDYAERLLQGLETIDWPEPLKEMQRNWIGKSTGAQVEFKVRGVEFKGEGLKFKEPPSHAGEGLGPTTIEIFTTRPDTIFGSTFMVVAPESDLVQQLITDEQRGEVNQYIEYVKSRSERDRMADVKTVTGAFTGSYAINPFTNEEIPIWTAEYVLASYGTGAVMAVPAHDSRDYAFAKKFGLPINQVVSGGDISKESYDAKEGTLINSGFLNGMEVKDAINEAIEVIEEMGIGKRKVNYRLRDAGFSRQRYWGEPFPIVFDGETPKPLNEGDLPITLPEVVSYKPTGTGESPIAAVNDWVDAGNGLRRETDTMPGYAGSSWYWLRYMDPHNKEAFVGKDKEAFWQNVDLYIGGSEHAVGHLLYARLWQKVLFDLGYVGKDEPFQKMVNQGMIQGTSQIMYRDDLKNEFISYEEYEKSNWTWNSDEVANRPASDKEQLESFEEPTRKFSSIHVPIEYVNANNELDYKKAFEEVPYLTGHKYSANDKGKIVCQPVVEKMSKSKHNVVTPDAMVEKYGADTLRMYEMFLGPITDSKPWNTAGIDGVFKFLRKFWNLFYNKQNEPEISDAAATKEELKVLHSCIQKIEGDIERLALNTCVSSFMICINDLQSLNCNKREILEPLTVLLSPFAPHIAEEAWQLLGKAPSVTSAPYPVFNPAYLVEDAHVYPIMINGKKRHEITLPAGIGQDEAIAKALAEEAVQKWTEGKSLRKQIFVPKKIINLVVG
ncbi:leucine--tRNA ligase [bacterium]|nr:leucine--tRNA ligase [bacterium]